MGYLLESGNGASVAPRIPVFLSVVIVVKNQAKDVESEIKVLQEYLKRIVDDYEIIIVDNGSNDNTASVLRRLSKDDGFPNLQVYCLLNEVDDDVAFWVGIERSLGDLTVTLDNPIDIAALDLMLLESQKCYDIVFAHNQTKSPINKILLKIFNILYKALNGTEVSSYSNNKLMSRRTVNFLAQHRYPVIAYRYLPMNTKLRQKMLAYCSKNDYHKRRGMLKRLRKGLKYLLIGKAPLRIAVSLSLFGATLNVLYAFYVFAVNIVLGRVAEGWTSMSLQISGMFFLMSLVLLLIGEHILQSFPFSNKLLPYYIFDEFTSEKIDRSNKLNVDSSMPMEVDYESL